jgi:hypothetical protein
VSGIFSGSELNSVWNIVKMNGNFVIKLPYSYFCSEMLTFKCLSVCRRKIETRL